jgi:hypothetical protein
VDGQFPTFGRRENRGRRHALAAARLDDLPRAGRRYEQGELTLDGLAAVLGASFHAIRRALHGLGVDTSNSAAKRSQATYRWEKARGLPANSAYRHAAEL